MKIMNKEELNKAFGETSFWSPKVLSSLKYVSGISFFDDLIESVSFELPANIIVRPNGMQIELLKGVTYYRTGIHNSDIISITLEDREQVFIEKEKSVVGRAIVGGLLLGPVGAVVGGMSGLKGTVQEKAKMPEMLLSIVYKADGEEKIIVLSTSYAKRKEAQDFFKKYYSDKFKISAGA
jgi:hypothetical protein